MDDLIAFLRARLRDDECSVPTLGQHAAAQSASVIMRRWSRSRLEAEINAKRQIIDAHRTEIDENVRNAPEFGHHFWCQTCDVPGDLPARNWCLTLRLLALPYSSYPDYHEGWRP